MKRNNISGAKQNLCSLPGSQLQLTVSSIHLKAKPLQYFCAGFCRQDPGCRFIDGTEPTRPDNLPLFALPANQAQRFDPPPDPRLGSFSSVWRTNKHSITVAQTLLPNCPSPR